MSSPPDLAGELLDERQPQVSLRAPPLALAGVEAAAVVRDHEPRVVAPPAANVEVPGVRVGHHVPYRLLRHAIDERLTRPVERVGTLEAGRHVHAARLERAQEVGDRRLEAGSGEMGRMELDEQCAKVAHGAAKLFDRAPEHRCIIAGAARPRPVCERREAVGEPGDLLHRARRGGRTPHAGARAPRPRSRSRAAPRAPRSRAGGGASATRPAAPGSARSARSHRGSWGRARAGAAASSPSPSRSAGRPRTGAASRPERVSACRPRSACPAGGRGGSPGD